MLRVLFYYFILFLTIVSCQKHETDSTGANQLGKETSPYLLQHASNPIHWQAWSDSIFNLATKKDRLVVVSIGYSSCHWCHVMERETFEQEDVAKIMNENFINVKVDREERPDVDQVYMTAVQLMTGNGGWPLNVIVLPNGQPLYGGTYHTKDDWMEVISAMDSLYREDKEKAYAFAEEVTNGIEQSNYIWEKTETSSLQVDDIAQGMANWKQQWDNEFGGEKGFPKFMIPTRQQFLMDYFLLYDDLEAEKHVKHSLDQMMMGGIYDHVGGGFYRYSTDAEWQIPHFEKMLYDNAQMLGLYAKAYRVFKDDRYKNIIEEVHSFLQEELKHDSGSFYSTIDAESEGVEGKFYVWSTDEIQQIITDDLDLFNSFYQIKEGVLSQAMTQQEFLVRHNMSQEIFDQKQKTWNDLLRAARNKRIRPAIDDKIITSWNALLLSGYVEAFKATGEKEYLEAAIHIEESLATNNLINGNPIHSYKPGSKKEIGFLDDYVFLARANFDLFTVTADKQYLEKSKNLVDACLNKFKDEESSLFLYREDQNLISKTIPTHDHVIPSANAELAYLLVELGHLYYDDAYKDLASEMLLTVKSLWEKEPQDYSTWSKVFLSQAQPYYEIAVVGEEATEKMQALTKDYFPNTLVVGSQQESDIALFDNRYSEGKTLFYVCKNNTCKLPVSTVEETKQTIKNF